MTQTRIEKLEAELHHCFHRIEELQEALREIVSLHHDHGAKAAEDIYIRDGMTSDIARKALEGKDE